MKMPEEIKDSKELAWLYKDDDEDIEEIDDLTAELTILDRSIESMSFR
jgi:hypothetical protein